MEGLLGRNQLRRRHHRRAPRRPGRGARIRLRAYRARAAFARQAGDVPGARHWAARAARLKRAFNKAFWLPGQGWYAVALDRGKRPVDALTSNIGHWRRQPERLVIDALSALGRIVSPQASSLAPPRFRAPRGRASRPHRRTCGPMAYLDEDDERDSEYRGSLPRAARAKSVTWSWPPRQTGSWPWTIRGSFGSATGPWRNCSPVRHASSSVPHSAARRGRAAQAELMLPGEGERVVEMRATTALKRQCLQIAALRDVTQRRQAECGTPGRLAASERRLGHCRNSIRRSAGLVRRGEPVTFQAVQREAGVSHAFFCGTPPRPPGTVRSAWSHTDGRSTRSRLTRPRSGSSAGLAGIVRMPGTAGGLRARRLDRSVLGLEPGGPENVTDTRDLRPWQERTAAPMLGIAKESRRCGR